MALGFCPQPPQWNWLYPRRNPGPGGPWVWVVVAVLVIELCMLPLRRPRVTAPALEVDGAVLITTEHGWGEKPIRRIIPPKPPEGSNWERVPCKEKWQHAINGACFAKVEGATPPCSAGLYEHKGGCFAPITKGQRPPSSIRK